MQLSDRVQKMQGSPIRKFNPIAIAAEDAGKKIYHLNIGNPDIETPDCYLEAIKKYESPTIGYAESGGDKNLQDAIIDYFKRYDVELERNDILVRNCRSSCSPSP